MKRLRNTEIGGNLGDRGIGETGNRDNIVAGLDREHLQHDKHPPSEDESSQVSRQSNSGQS
jgi:hypothetical protein